jgi:hypothetical protein
MVSANPTIWRLMKENPKRGGGRHAWGLRQLRLCRGTGELSHRAASNIIKDRPVATEVKVTAAAIPVLGVAVFFVLQITPSRESLGMIMRVGRLSRQGGVRDMFWS